MSVSFTSTCLPSSTRPANFAPAPIHVNGGLPAGVFSNVIDQGNGGSTRTRAWPMSLPSSAWKAPPWNTPGLPANGTASKPMPPPISIKISLPCRLPIFTGPAGAG